MELDYTAITIAIIFCVTWVIVSLINEKKGE